MSLMMRIDVLSRDCTHVCHYYSTMEVSAARVVSHAGSSTSLGGENKCLVNFDRNSWAFPEGWQSQSESSVTSSQTTTEGPPHNVMAIHYSHTYSNTTGGVVSVTSCVEECRQLMSVHVKKVPEQTRNWSIANYAFRDGCHMP